MVGIALNLSIHVSPSVARREVETSAGERHRFSPGMSTNLQLNFFLNICVSAYSPWHVLQT